MDYSLLFIVLFLLSFGLVMLYSTSSYEAALEYGDSAYYLKRQLIFTIFGLVLMTGVSFIPYTFWKKVSVLASASPGSLCSCSRPRSPRSASLFSAR